MSIDKIKCVLKGFKTFYSCKSKLLSNYFIFRMKLEKRVEELCSDEEGIFSRVAQNSRTCPLGMGWGVVELKMYFTLMPKVWLKL